MFTHLSKHVALIPINATIPQVSARFFALAMPIAEAQRKAIDEIIGVIISTAPGRGKRQIAGMFLELVDRESWPEYYEVWHYFYF